MSKLTHKNASLVIKVLFGQGFSTGVIRHRFGPNTRAIYYCPPEDFGVAYPVAYGQSWEEAIAKARPRMTVKAG